MTKLRIGLAGSALILVGLVWFTSNRPPRPHGTEEVTVVWHGTPRFIKHQPDQRPH